MSIVYDILFILSRIFFYFFALLKKMLDYFKRL